MKKHIPSPPTDFDENPAWTAADFERARPLNELFPKAITDWKNRGGRPLAAQPKLHIGFRLAADVVQGIRASGRGYNQRVEALLREALSRGKL